MIKEGAQYEGVRIKVSGLLGTARLSVQVDIAFGDAVHPQPEERDFPVLLDSPPPRLRMYPLESAIAEKFQAMVHLARANSRMKDFYDLWWLCGKAEQVRQSGRALNIDDNRARPWNDEIEACQHDPDRQLRIAVEVLTNGRDTAQARAQQLEQELERLERRCELWRSHVDVAAATLVESLEADSNVLLQALHQFERAMSRQPLRKR